MGGFEAAPEKQNLHCGCHGKSQGEGTPWWVDGTQGQAPVRSLLQSSGKGKGSGLESWATGRAGLGEAASGGSLGAVLSLLQGCGEPGHASGHGQSWASEKKLQDVWQVGGSEQRSGPQVQWGEGLGEPAE